MTKLLKKFYSAYQKIGPDVVELNFELVIYTLKNFEDQKL